MPTSPDSPTGPPTPWSPPSQPRDPQATRSEGWFGGQQASPGGSPADYPQTGAWAPPPAYPQPPAPPGPGGYPPHPPGSPVPTPPPNGGYGANDPRYGGGGGYGAPPPPGAPPPNGYYGQPQQPGYPPPAYPGQATQPQPGYPPQAPQPGYPPNGGYPGGYQGQGGPPAPGYPPAAYAAQATAPMAPTTPSSGAGGANDPRNWGEATRQYAAFQHGRDAGPAAEDKRNMPATVSLFTWVIPLIGLVVGITGLVTARRSGVGLKRAVAGTLLSLLVLGVIGVFVPKVLKASDPGCTYFKGTALPAYNQMIGNLDHQKLTSASGTQVRAVAAELAVAQGKSKSASVQSALHSLITQLATIQNDASKGSLPASATTALNSAASSLDSACGSGY